MNAGVGSWLLGMSLGASAIGGMLGIFIVLAATTFASALLYTISGFGFAVLAVGMRQFRDTYWSERGFNWCAGI
jgi:hypothetical protein